MAISRFYCGLALSFLATQSVAAVFDQDDRIPVASDPGKPFSPIGVVYTASKTHYATGFLVSECHVLTVKHVVGDNSPAENKRLLFGVGPRTMKGAWTTKGRVVANGQFMFRDSAREVGQGRSRDWLLLKLDNCLGRTFGFLTLTSARLDAGFQVASAGFPRDRSLKFPTLDPACKIRAPLGQTVLHDCASRAGSSGAPIFRQVSRNGISMVEVVAMHSAGVPDKGVRAFDYAYSSIAIPMGSILPKIRQLIASPSNQLGLAGALPSSPLEAMAAAVPAAPAAARSGSNGNKGAISDSAGGVGGVGTASTTGRTQPSPGTV